MLLGCTEKVPIAPQYTEDTKWAPTIRLIGSGYQRFGLSIADSPDRQISRNILQYVVEYRSSSAAGFVPLDTASTMRFLPSEYNTSHPVLQEGQEYAVRLVAEYRNGVHRDTLVLIDQSWLFGPIIYSAFDLNTLAFVGNSSALDSEESAQLGSLAFDGLHIFVTTLTFAPYLQQLRKIEMASGEIVFASPNSSRS